MSEPAADPNLVEILQGHRAATAAHEQTINQLHSNQTLLFTQQKELHDQLRQQAEALRGLAESVDKLLRITDGTQAQSSSMPNAGASPAHIPVPPTAPPTHSEPRLQLPLRYSGESGKCQSFLTQCQIFFDAQPSQYQYEKSRVALILSLLTGSALAWADPLIRSNSPIMNTAKALTKEMVSVFDHEVNDKDAAMRLLQLRQGSRSVAEFSITFRSLAGEAGWDERPLMSLFTNALSDSVKDALAAMEEPETFGALVSIAIRIDNRIRERERERRDKRNRTTPDVVTPPAPIPAPRRSLYRADEPMQVDSSAVCETKETCLRTEWCRYCRLKGHTKNDCPKLMGNAQSR